MAGRTSLLASIVGNEKPTWHCSTAEWLMPDWREPQDFLRNPRLLALRLSRFLLLDTCSGKAAPEESCSDSDEVSDEAGSASDEASEAGVLILDSPLRAFVTGKLLAEGAIGRCTAHGTLGRALQQRSQRTGRKPLLCTQRQSCCTRRRPTTTLWLWNSWSGTISRHSSWNA